MKYTTTGEINEYYLKQLKYTQNNVVLNTAERLSIVNNILDSGAEQHYKDTSQRLIEDCSDPYLRIKLYYRMIQYPLECIGSYICGETNIADKEKRQKYDGQIRKRADGTTYQRKANCTDSTDNPDIIIAYHEQRYNIDDTIDNFKIGLTDNENMVLEYLLNGMSMKDIEHSTDLTYKQIRNLREKLKIKILEQLYAENNLYQFNIYKDFCNKMDKITQKGTNAA